MTATVDELQAGYYVLDWDMYANATGSSPTSFLSQDIPVYPMGLYVDPPVTTVSERVPADGLRLADQHPAAAGHGLDERRGDAAVRLLDDLRAAAGHHVPERHRRVGIHHQYLLDADGAGVE